MNSKGKAINFDYAWKKMGTVLKEEMHKKYAPCEPQVLYDAYVKAHKAKFKTDWEVDIEE